MGRFGDYLAVRVDEEALEGLGAKVDAYYIFAHFILLNFVRVQNRGIALNTMPRLTFEILKLLYH